MTDRPPQAFLFWDDSALPNANSSGHEVVRAIREVAANLNAGIIKSLRFYTDVAATKVISPAMCSALQCSGVSIVDTASGGRQGAASKMLLADLFMHALDESGTFSVMIVVSADPDLGYPISALRLRGRCIFLVCPPTVDPHFLHSADGTLLEGGVLEKRTLISASHHNAELLRAIPSHFPPSPPVGCLSDKTSEKPTTKVRLARKQEEAEASSIHGPRELAGKVSEPVRQGNDMLDALLTEGQVQPLVISVDCLDGDKVTPVANDAHSPYLLCPEAVEACSDSTGLIGAALFSDVADIEGANSLPRVWERILLGTYDESPQLFYADMMSMLDNAQTCYQQSKEAVEDAQELERAFEVAFCKHILGAKVSEYATSSFSHNPSSITPHSKQAAAPPRQAANHADLEEAQAASTLAAWSIADLPWPIPAHFHVLVQFLNEEITKHRTGIYSWDLLKTPILMRRPNLLQESIGPVGRKDPWNLYLKSAVKLGILQKMKKPRRVSLTEPFLLKPRRSASSLHTPMASPVPDLPSRSLHSPQPGPPETFLPGLQATAIRDSELGLSPPPSIHIPPHFYILIEYLKEEMASGTAVHRRGQLRKPLLSRQPNLLIDAGLAGVNWHVCRESPMVRYFQIAAELGIIGMDEATLPATLWLSPEYFNWSRPPSSPADERVLTSDPAESSTFPGIPAYFDVLIHELRARRGSGRFYMKRETLFKPLLERQPYVFLQAGTSHHNHPINQYIIKAEKLGVVVTEGDQVALHSDFH